MSLVTGLTASGFALANSVQGDSEKWRKAQQIHKTQQAVVFSERFELTQSKAYQIQKAYVKNAVAKGAVELGYKAGLTNKAAQERFGIASAITGVLLQPPAREGLQNPVFQLSNTHKLMIELELAFKLKAPILKPITSAELEKYIAGFAPAVELPDISFSDNHFTGLDVVANNALAYEYIVGEFADNLANVNNTKLSLYCNGKLLTSGLSNKAMDDQRHALVWMINHLLDHGYRLRKGQVLLTGNLAEMVAAKPCAYTAKFSGFKPLSFTVE